MYDIIDENNLYIRANYIQNEHHFHSSLSGLEDGGKIKIKWEKLM